MLANMHIAIIIIIFKKQYMRFENFYFWKNFYLFIYFGFMLS